MNRIALAFGIAALAALPAQAQEDLAKKYNCLACHAVDKKVVGPAYKDVAAKYRNDKAAEAKEGGHGTARSVEGQANPGRSLKAISPGLAPAEAAHETSPQVKHQRGSRVLNLSRAGRAE